MPSLTTIQSNFLDNTYPIELSLGNASVPSLSFSGDANSGLYSPGADQVAVATNGTRRLLIDSAGALTLDTGDATIYGITVGRGAAGFIGNTVVGNGAFASNTGGSSNVAIGYQSLYSNTTGGNNNANGASALYSNTTGYNNNANGAGALYYNTTGVYNTANGYEALKANTTGGNNTANGSQALFSNTTGSNNTCYGFTAGYSLTTGSNNTIIGTILGTAGLANTVIIGAGATERLRIDSSGRVGIGTSSPSRTLDVTGTARVSSVLTVGSYIQGTTQLDLYGDSSSSSGVRLDSSGRVGINTTTPTTTLDVDGTFNVSSSIVAGDPAVTTHTLYGHTIVDRTGVNGNNPWLSIYSGGTNVAYINGGGNFYGTNATLTGGFITGNNNSPNGNASINGYLQVDRGATAGSNVWFQVQTGAVKHLFVNGLSQVGIGTGSPSVDLEIQSTSINSVVKLKGTSSTNGGQLQVNGTDLILRNRDSGSLQFWTSDSQKAQIDSFGKFGIGTSSPTAQLHVFSPDTVGTTAYFRITNSSFGSGTYRNIHIDGLHPNGASLWKGIDITPVQATTAPMTGIDMSWNQTYAEARGVNINVIKNTHSGGGNGIGVYSRVSASGVNDRAFTATAGWFITDKETGALDPYTSYPLRVENKSTTGDTNLLGLYTDASTQRLRVYYDRTNEAIRYESFNRGQRFYVPGNTTLNNASYYFESGHHPDNVGGRQFGLRIEQGGARYTDQTALYATHTNTIGNYAGNYRGVHGVTTFPTQAGGTTEAIFGETTIPGWNYQGRHCGVRGIAQGGSDAFYNTYGLSPNHGAFGGHFVAYGKADVCGVYADAYQTASPGAGTQAVPLIVATNGSEFIHATDDKYLRMLSGSGGIQFNGDTSAANALDDYEEGTWTPSYKATTTDPSITYENINRGKYIKIGRMVYIQVTIQSTIVSSTGSGNLFIGGLPYTPQTDYFGGYSTFAVGNNTAINVGAGERVSVHLDGGDARIYLLVQNDDTSANALLTGAAINSNASSRYLFFSGCYLTAS